MYIRNIYGKNDQLKSRFQTLKNIKAKLEVIENNLNNEINDIKNNDNKSFFDKLDEIVNVKNQKDLEYLAKIKDIFDEQFNSGNLITINNSFSKKIRKKRS